MDIYKALVMVTFIMVTIIMISQCLDSSAPKVSDVLQLMNILPYYEIKAYKNGKRLRTSELIQHINSPVKANIIKDGILYIQI